MGAFHLTVPTAQLEGVHPCLNENHHTPMSHMQPHAAWYQQLWSLHTPAWMCWPGIAPALPDTRVAVRNCAQCIPLFIRETLGNIQFRTMQKHKCSSPVSHLTKSCPLVGARNAILLITVMKL